MVGRRVGDPFRFGAQNKGQERVKGKNAGTNN